MNNFKNELTKLINKYNKESKFNTPDYILGQYIERCLEAFNDAVQARDAWYGVKLMPGQLVGAPACFENGVLPENMPTETPS